MGLSRRQLAVYVVLALFVTAIGVRYLLAGGEPAADAGLALSELSAGATSSPAAASPSPAAAAPLVVYVCGAVRSPGVYTFAPGARVADLIDRAGGATGAAELETINLAAVLTDGQQVVVPRRGETAAATAAGDPAAAATGSGGAAAAPAVPGALVNLNTATLAELDTLPGVGPSTAQKILDYRTSSGGFKSVDDLKNVSGIGDVRFAELKDLVTV